MRHDRCDATLATAGQRRQRAGQQLDGGGDVGRVRELVGAAGRTPPFRLRTNSMPRSTPAAASTPASWPPPEPRCRSVPPVAAAASRMAAPTRSPTSHRPVAVQRRSSEIVQPRRGLGHRRPQLGA